MTKLKRCSCGGTMYEYEFTATINEIHTVLKCSKCSKTFTHTQRFTLCAQLSLDGTAKKPEMIAINESVFDAWNNKSST